MLNFCDFIQVYVFTTNQRFKPKWLVLMLSNNRKNTTVKPNHTIPEQA